MADRHRLAHAAPAPCGGTPLPKQRATLYNVQSHRTSPRDEPAPARIDLAGRRIGIKRQGVMKFIHAADLHLDSRLEGLARYEGAPVDELRGATRRALENLVALAIEEQVAFVLIAGDVYDGDWRDYNTGLYFARQMTRLREARIPVVMIRGNHDAESQISRGLRLPDNVTELPTNAPGTKRFNDLRVAIHGQGFATAAVKDDLSAAYPAPVPGWFNIGLLHTSAEGRPGHENYAPCSPEALASHGYDYWALGHVHQREVLCEDPWIVFPGNPQGRHIRETGAKGCALVEVVDGRVARVEHRPLDVVRWVNCSIDAAGAADGAELLERVAAGLQGAESAAEGRLLAARLSLAGSCPAHAWLEQNSEQFIADCRALATDRFGGRVWLEKIALGTRLPIQPAHLLPETDPRTELMQFVLELSADPSRLKEFGADLAELKRKLPPELRAGPEKLALDDPGWLAAQVNEVVHVLLPYLHSQEGPA